MSEKMKVTEQQVVVNPFDFAYPANTPVTVDGNLLARLLQYTASTAQEEMKEQIVINRFPTATGPARDANGMMTQYPEEVIVFTSPKGKAAEALFNELMEAHSENIESGLAVRVDTLNNDAPSLDLGN